MLRILGRNVDEVPKAEGEEGGGGRAPVAAAEGTGTGGGGGNGLTKPERSSFCPQQSQIRETREERRERVRERQKGEQGPESERERAIGQAA
jgi:hypothetical protein